MAEMDTHGGTGTVFLWNLSAFLFRSAGSKFFSGLNNFSDNNAMLGVTIPSHALRVDTFHL